MALQFIIRRDTTHVVGEEAFTVEPCDVSARYYTVSRDAKGAYRIWCHSNSRMRDTNTDGPTGRAIIAAIEAEHPVVVEAPVTGCTIPEGNPHGYAEFTTCPTWSAPIRNEEGDTTNVGEGAPVWSGVNHPPAVGSIVRVTINDIGLAEVLGYFVESGWLGLLVRPSNPPEWYVKKNNPGSICHVFGIECYTTAPEPMHLGTQTGSLVNHIYSSANIPAPVVGMGATILMWSDRHAGTVVEVRADGSFTVQRDKATRADSNGMSDCQEYTYEPDPNGPRYDFAPVKRGKAKGAIRENGRKDGYGIILGRRDEHYDFSF